MKLIWTYSEKLKKGPYNSKLSNEYILDMYYHSIECGKKHYPTCIYTTEDGYKFFKDKVDEIKIIPSDFDYVFLGDLKYHVMEIETNPFILIDGDLFLEDKLTISEDCEIAVEYNLPSPSEHLLYFNECFVREGIEDVIPYWKNGFNSYNLGLVYVNTTDYKDELCNDFKKIKKFYKEKIEPVYGFDKLNRQPSISGVQYFFSMFCKYKNIKVDIIGSNNKFIHMAAHRKFDFYSKIKKYRKSLI
jgi:hypothetical protein